MLISLVGERTAPPPETGGSFHLSFDGFDDRVLVPWHVSFPTEVFTNQGSSEEPSRGVRAELLSRYGVQIVVTNAFEFVTGVAYPIALALGHASETDWQLVYQDAQALVYARDVPENRALIEKHSHEEGDCLQGVQGRSPREDSLLPELRGASAKARLALRCHIHRHSLCRGRLPIVQQIRGLTWGLFDQLCRCRIQQRRRWAVQTVT